MLKRIVLVFTMCLMVILVVSGCKATPKNSLGTVTAAVNKAKTMKSGNIVSNTSLISNVSVLCGSSTSNTKFFVNKGVIINLIEKKVNNTVQTAYYNNGTNMYEYTASKGKNWVDTPKDFQKVTTSNISQVSKLFLSPPSASEIATQSTKTVNGQEQIVLNLDLQKENAKNSNSSIKDVFQKYTYTYTINSDGYPVNLIIDQQVNITSGTSTTSITENDSYSLTDINKYSKLDRPSY